jgi:hypothetical protein
MSQNQTLSTRQRKDLEGLLLTGDVGSTAATANVSRVTVYRWMRQPAFAAAVREAEAIDELSLMSIRLGRAATGTLAAAMSDKNAPLGPRVRAAGIALSRLLQLRELATPEARITVLEETTDIIGAGR